MKPHIKTTSGFQSHFVFRPTDSVLLLRCIAVAITTKVNIQWTVKPSGDESLNEIIVDNETASGRYNTSHIV